MLPATTPGYYVSCNAIWGNRPMAPIEWKGSKNTCLCQGTGWIKYRARYKPCDNHPFRPHPGDVLCGRYPTLWVLDQNGNKREIYGDMFVPGRTDMVYTISGTETAKNDARRLTEKFSKYGWKVVLKMVEQHAPDMLCCAVMDGDEIVMGCADVR